MSAKIGKRAVKAKESKELPKEKKAATKKREVKAEEKVVGVDDSKLKSFSGSGPIDVMLA
jgi:hypothetical protein